MSKMAEIGYFNLSSHIILQYETKPKLAVAKRILQS